MKKTLFLFVACVIAFGLASCGGNSADKARIAELEAKLAARDSAASDTERTLSTTEEVVEKNSNSSSSSNSSSLGGFEEQTSEDPNNTIVGAYEFSDNIHTWVLVVNNDETAYIYNKDQGESVKAYGSWFKYSNMKAASFTFSDKAPRVWFQGDETSLRDPYLTKDWIYFDFSAANAKNPEKRFPVTKVK
jgi:lipoprotein